MSDRRPTSKSLIKNWRWNLKKVREFLDGIQSRFDMGDPMVRQGVINFAKNWISGLEVERSERIGKKK